MVVVEAALVVVVDAALAAFALFLVVVVFLVDVDIDCLVDDKLVVLVEEWTVLVDGSNELVEASLVDIEVSANFKST